MNTVEDLHDLVAPSGALAQSNLQHFTSRAITLLCLQIEQNELAKESVSVATDGWPRTAGHAL